MTDVYPPDYTTPTGQVRLLIGDHEQRIDPMDTSGTPSYMFSDDAIGGFVALNPLHIKYAAASAMDVIATNEALVQKKIRTEDLQTDGPAVANAARLHSANLRADAKHEVELADALESFDVVDFEPTPESWTAPWVSPLSNGYGPYSAGLWIA